MKPSSGQGVQGSPRRLRFRPRSDTRPEKRAWKNLLECRSVMAITRQVFVQPSAIAVGLKDEHLVLCHEVFGGHGLAVHRADMVAACDRISRLMPHVVVASTEMSRDDLDMIEDRSVAIGAVLVLLRPERDYGSIERDLDAAAEVARERLARRSRTS
jgi:hypothetical protein